MLAIQYPFIDIAVHTAVRERFARGEALALFSLDLSNVLWANGAGAAFFGTASIYDLLEDGPPRQDVTFRQITSMARQLQTNGERRKLVVRAGSGFRLVPMEAHLERLEIRAGEPVILFSMPVFHANDKARAEAILRGFDDPDTHMALLDGTGQVIRGSGNFDRLGITPRTAQTVVQMAEHHTGGLMKRPIPTARGYLPAAVGKISDEPAMFLLFAVETLLGSLDVSDGFAADTTMAEKPQAQAAVADQPAIAHPVVDQPQPEAPAASTPSMEFADVVRALGAIDELESEPEDISKDTVAPVLTHEEEPVSSHTPEINDVAAAEEMSAPEASRESDAAEEVVAEPAKAILEDAEAPSEPPLQVEEPITTEAASTQAPSDDDIAVQEVSAEVPLPVEEPLDAPVAVSDQPDAVPAEVEREPSPAPAEAFSFQPTSRAVRFVWKIDALGCFSDISPEFATAVGPGAANIEGQTFNDLAALFNLDPDGQITALLSKRDTWSGKTIYWPIEGTSLKVPVDLAALPTYTRNRDFDGFRGFGVVRLADAVEDPDKVGLSLVPNASEQDQPEIEEVFEPSVSEPVAAAEPEIEAKLAEEEPAAPVSDDSILASKVVHLESRRIVVGEGLSPGEHAAFREIARKLDALGVKPVSAEKALDDSNLPEAQNNNSKPETAPQQAEKHIDHAALEALREVKEPTTAASLPIPVLPMPMLPVSKRDVTFSPDVLDMLPIALLAHRGDHLIHANPEFLALTGYANLDALKAEGGLDVLLQEADLSPEAEAAGKLVAVRADGQQLLVSARLQSIRWEEASALLLALVPQSMPAQPPAETPAALEDEKTTEEASIVPSVAPSMADVARLRVEVEELRSILETATDGVVTISSDGEIRSVNGAASALFNYDEGDIRGKPFVTLFAHESQRAILDYLSGLTGHGVASVLNDGREVIGREASGGFIPLFMAIGRLSSSNGFCAVIRDITQWKRTEEELRNAKRVAETANAHKSDFLARVSHEIRTPLNAIIGFADIMADERFGPIGHSRYAEYSSDIGRSGRHVLDIVNDLLDISKIEAGEMDLDFIAVGLNETVSEAVSLVQPQANAQRVIIRTALSQSVPNVVADLRSIKQIVLNILSNAIRFTPSGGQIIVSTAYESNGSVTLRVRDTGIGMSRSELDQAMKPFRQVSPGGARLRGDGTGLGLPLTKAMADANRATFAIHSTPNEGTLVEITFPSPRVLAG
jgi:PAS domain S-box-containing protein